MPAAPYVPLRVLSAFTMLEGAIDPKAIAKHARKLGFPAVALTDRNGLYAAMPFSDACIAAGVQPIIGTLLAVARPAPADREGKPPVLDWLALYAQDETGYDNLCALVSAAHLDRPVQYEPHVALTDLAGRSDGLLALTAGGEGALTRLLAEGQSAAATHYVEQLEALFPDRLYVELARRGNDEETRAETALIELAYARDLPLVATNPAQFAEAEFHSAHDVMLCIANSAYVETADRPRSSPDSWLKPASEMAARFADVPEAIANTLVVAQRCAVAAPSRKPILPSLAGDRDAEVAQLRDDARAGLEARLAAIEEPVAEPQVYRDRLEFELDVIVNMGFAGYFLIVADFIKWAKQNDIPVGPGRGSGAGSVVAWSLTITDLDPIRLGLLFERFLNPERVSMPDFDIDFCETRRGEVIQYVQEKYGRDHVAQIITFGRLKARAVLKDTGRVLQMGYNQVDRLAKLVPNHPTDPWTLERTLNGVSEFAAEYRDNEEIRRLIDLAMKLEGLPRHSSTHAAGVVIGDRPLHQLVPLYRDPRSDIPVTQFDMKYVEAAGLVKFDFLGLKTLSVLQRAVALLKQRGLDVDLDRLAWDDEEVFKLLQRGETVGVFQLESEGMRRTLAAVRPTCFEDIIALVALYRPGPMDNIPMFGARKNGREPMSFPHPLLEGLLKETYGIFVYQEQVMQAAQILAGYSLGQADLLRRAMGKKIKAEMDAQRAGFVAGCSERGINKAKANELFDLIDKFAGYGFNKSHAAAYALLSYQTAWLKAHHPVEFYAASMSFDIALTDKLAVFVDDARRLEVEIKPPCINASGADFTVEGNAVRYALGALKGVGERAMNDLAIERSAGGRFNSLDEFAARVDPRLLNRRQLESLAAAGAFDGITTDRASVFAGAEIILAHAASAAEGRASGQSALFGDSHADVAPIRLPKTEHWSLAQKMAAERDSFGFYFSAHPVDRYSQLARAHGARPLAEQSVPSDGSRTSGKMAAMVEEARWRTSAKGRRYLVATLSDTGGQFVASVFDEDVAKSVEAAARNGDCMLLSVELDRRPGEDAPRVAIRSLTPLDRLTANARLILNAEAADEAAVRAFATRLRSARGGRGTVNLKVRLANGKEAPMMLGRDFLLDAELVAEVERIDGISEVALSAETSVLALAS